jgi:integrase/recombinase XerD
MSWKAAIIKHNKQSRIGVSFEKNIELINRIKQIEGSRWSQSLKIWHIPDTVENRIRFKIELIPTLTEEAIVQMQKFADWLNSKRYSPNTIKTYTEAFKIVFPLF